MQSGKTGPPSPADQMIYFWLTEDVRIHPLCVLLADGANSKGGLGGPPGQPSDSAATAGSPDRVSFGLSHCCIDQGRKLLVPW